MRLHIKSSQAQGDDDVGMMHHHAWHLGVVTGKEACPEKLRTSVCVEGTSRWRIASTLSTHDLHEAILPWLTRYLRSIIPECFAKIYARYARRVTS